MSAHTPGPWVVDARELAGDGARIGDAKGRCLAHTSAVRNLAGNRLDPEHHIEPAEALANARLIAAAPDMLAALKGLFALDAADSDEPKGHRAWARAIAAIAKAEGKS